MKIVVIIIIALVVILGCCGGGVFFVYYAGTHMSGQAVQPQIEGTPAINEKIGVISEITLSWSGTTAMADPANGGTGEGDRLVFDIAGDKGSGLLIVKQGPQGIVPADWAILEIDGKSYVVFGNPPEDLGAERLAGTPSKPDSSEDGDDSGEADSDEE